MEQLKSSLIKVFKISENITPDIEIKAVLVGWPQEINSFSKGNLEPLIMELANGLITKVSDD